MPLRGRTIDADLLEEAFLGPAEGSEKVNTRRKTANSSDGPTSWTSTSNTVRFSPSLVSYDRCLRTPAAAGPGRR
jgi:hypothetical protein